MDGLKRARQPPVVSEAAGERGDQSGGLNRQGKELPFREEILNYETMAKTWHFFLKTRIK